MCCTPLLITCDASTLADNWRAAAVVGTPVYLTLLYTDVGGG